MKLRLFSIALILVVLAPLLFSLTVYLRNRSTIENGVKFLKGVVTKDFHDPESARFRNVQLKTFQRPVLERLRAYVLSGATFSDYFSYNLDFMVLCGEVNAKNALGAYVGYKMFYAAAIGEPVAFIGPNVAPSMCALKENVIYSEP